MHSLSFRLCRYWVSPEQSAVSTLLLSCHEHPCPAAAAWPQSPPRDRLQQHVLRHEWS